MTPALFVIALALSAPAQDAPAAPAPAPPADVPATPTPAPPPPPTPPPTTTTTAPVSATSADRAVIAVFAEGAHDRRFATAAAYALTSAAFIGGAITYVAVSYLDFSLQGKPAEDTIVAGAVLGATSVVPAALAGVELFGERPAEKRLAEIDAGVSHDALVAQQAEAASTTSMVHIGTAIAFFAGGAACATAGGYSLARPHNGEQRTFVTHGTGAELIGLGVASVGAGVFTLIAGNDDEKLLHALQTSAE